MNLENKEVFNNAETKGLSSQEAASKRLEFGLNRLPNPPMPGPFVIFIRQFLSPFIYILLIAAIASFFLQQIPNAVFILIVLLINALIGTTQEYSAQRAALALRQMVKGEARVVRDGIIQKIDIEELVPGDYVLLSSGDKVPADLKLSASQDLSIDESMLTGESVSVAKDVLSISSQDAPISEKLDHCFAGTIITHGRAEGIIVSTGISTEIGKIANQVTGKRISEPPLMIRIKKFTYQVALAIVISIFLLIGLMLAKGGYELESMVMMAIGLAVSTIPEGLPAALTVALAIGMQRMAKHNVIIRKLVAVESLGSCTFICTDKTGTLTVNQLTIREIILPDNSTYTVSGEGVRPGGDITGDAIEPLELLCITGLLANESQLNYAGQEWTADGDIVDVAFLVLAKKLGLSLSNHRDLHKQLEMIPYESERAYSGSLNLYNGVQPHLFVKGSPEKLLEMSSAMLVNGNRQTIDRDLINKQFEGLASKGYRIIGLAYREAKDSAAVSQLDDMVFLGMVAMIDPVRPEARDAILRCRAGGIEVAMLTGDHPLTAKSIAHDVGLYNANDRILTGTMIREMNAKNKTETEEAIRSTRIFARIEPSQKEQIVKCFMDAGHLVAVTGDGVNDAPAMRCSNVGVAMGKRGTDVAKETADLIITDDNFSSIVDGIEQGRIVYNNIRKVIGLLIATGFSAILLFLCTVMAGLPMPLTAVQLLWLNLVANGLQDVALAFEPREGNELSKRPRRPSEPVLESHIIKHVLVSGTTMGLLAFFVYSYLMNYTTHNIEEARNLTLMLMILFGNIHALSSRSEMRSIFSISLFSNPFLVIAVPLAQIIHIIAMYTPGLNQVLDISPISLQQWANLAVIALGFLMVEEVQKLISRNSEVSAKH